MARLLAGSPIFVDGLTGTSTIADSDVLLLRSQQTGHYGLFRRSTSGIDRTALLRQVETWIDTADLALETGGIREILILGFGPGRAGRYIPPGATTALERTLMALRHEDVRRDGDAVLDLCGRLRRGLPVATHPLLRGVIEREEADAMMRGLCGNRPAELKYRAADAFFRAGGRAHPARIARRLRLVASAGGDQLELPMIAPKPQSRVDWSIGYRVEKILARRIPLPADATSDDPRSYGPWRLIGVIELPDITVCKLLAGAPARTFKAAIRVECGSAQRAWTIDAGYVSELSLILGLAGRTGASGSAYEARLHSETCTIHPRRSEMPVGVLAKFDVEASASGPHRVEVELTSGSQCLAVVNLDMPGPGKRFRSCSKTQFQTIT